MEEQIFEYLHHYLNSNPGKKISDRFTKRIKENLPSFQVLVDLGQSMSMKIKEDGTFELTFTTGEGVVCTTYEFRKVIINTEGK